MHLLDVISHQVSKHINMLSLFWNKNFKSRSRISMWDIRSSELLKLACFSWVFLTRIWFLVCFLNEKDLSVSNSVINKRVLQCYQKWGNHCSSNGWPQKRFYLPCFTSVSWEMELNKGQDNRQCGAEFCGCVITVAFTHLSAHSQEVWLQQGVKYLCSCSIYNLSMHIWQWNTFSWWILENSRNHTPKHTTKE